MQMQDLIKEYRKRNKLTQEQLATELQISPTTIQNWESGRTNPELSILDKLTTTLNIDPEQLIRSLTENFISIKDGCIKESAKDLKWWGVLPNDFDLTPIQELSFNKEEQEMFRIIAIHSRFNGNPASDLLKTIQDSQKVLTCLGKFGKLKLYTSSYQTFGHFEAYGEIFSHSFHLSNIGHFISNWIQNHPNKNFSLYNLSFHEFLALCRLYELNVPSEEAIKWLEELVIKEEKLLSTFSKGSWRDKWIKITPTDYFNQNDFCYSDKDKIEELSSQIRKNHSMTQVVSSDYYQIEEIDFNDPNYLLEKEMYLKKVELQKEYPDSFNEKENDFKFLIEEHIIPTQKARDLIKLLNE